MGPKGSGLRVGADKVGYQESSNTPGIADAREVRFLASSFKRGKGHISIEKTCTVKANSMQGTKKVNTRYVELD